MNAAEHGKQEIQIAELVEALCGVKVGYRITFAGMPGWVFKVAAPEGKANWAIYAAKKSVLRELPNQHFRSVTFQRLRTIRKS